MIISSPAISLSFIEGSRSLLLVLYPEHLLLYDIAQKLVPVKAIPIPGGNCACMALVPKKKNLVVIASEKELRLVDTESSLG